jgi:hypothetical protein
MKEPSKTRNKRRDKRALERAIVRTLRHANLDRMPWNGRDYPEVPAGTLTPEVQATLYGLEKARRAC